MATFSITTDPAGDEDLFAAFSTASGPGGAVIPGTAETVNFELAYFVQQRVQSYVTQRIIAAALAGAPPPVPAPMKPNRFAYVKAFETFSILPAWEAAVMAAIDTAAGAGSQDPKAVYRWWFEDTETRIIDPTKTFWKAVAAEMDKSGGWGTTSEAEVIALAQQIAPSNQG